MLQLRLKLPYSNLTLYFSEDLEFGPVVAKGCNAVVYSARWKVTRTPLTLETSTEKRSPDLIKGSYQYYVKVFIYVLMQEGFFN